MLPVAVGCDDGAKDACNTGANDPLPTLPSYSYSGTPGPANLFEHGVASGDPLTDRVILWTRVSPTSSSPVDVWWEMALDTAFERRVAQGTFATDASRDFTVKVDASGLLPGRTYYYRFFALGVQSPIGRTKTAVDGSPSRLRFAVVTCSSYAHGLFHAYRRIAEREDLDAVIHLGDYIYEYGNGDYGSYRTYDPPTEILSLDDYRRRYKHYRKDADLQAIHQQHPFIAVWDDHETANDTYKDGAQNHDEGPEGTFVARKAASLQAYLEYMPIRSPGGEKIFRTLSYGNLVDLICLDTRRYGRDQQLEAVADEVPSRTILGTEQEAWANQQLASSTSVWRVLVQQVMMAPMLLLGAPVNLDAWDGYPSARGRMIEAIRGSLGNVVVLTGDIHSSWANDVPGEPLDPSTYDPATGAGSVAVEFVTPSVTSAGLEGDNGSIQQLFVDSNPHTKYVDLKQHGYLVLDVRAAKVQADWYYVEDIRSETGGKESHAVSYAVYSGKPSLRKMSGPESPKASCELAPSS